MLHVTELKGPPSGSTIIVQKAVTHKARNIKELVVFYNTIVTLMQQSAIPGSNYSKSRHGTPPVTQLSLFNSLHRLSCIPARRYI
jgi:hypothetical protein